MKTYVYYRCWNVARNKARQFVLCAGNVGRLPHIDYVLAIDAETIFTVPALNKNKIKTT